MLSLEIAESSMIRVWINAWDVWIVYLIGNIYCFGTLMDRISVVAVETVLCFYHRFNSSWASTDYGHCSWLYPTGSMHSVVVFDSHGHLPSPSHDFPSSGCHEFTFAWGQCHMRSDDHEICLYLVSRLMDLDVWHCPKLMPKEYQSRSHTTTCLPGSVLPLECNMQRHGIPHHHMFILCVQTRRWKPAMTQILLWSHRYTQTCWLKCL